MLEMLKNAKMLVNFFLTYIRYISELRIKVIRIKLFIRSSNNIEPLVPTIIYNCLIYLYNSLLILFLKVIVS